MRRRARQGTNARFAAAPGGGMSFSQRGTRARPQEDGGTSVGSLAGAVERPGRVDRSAEHAGPERAPERNHAGVSKLGPVQVREASGQKIMRCPLCPTRTMS
jgi:hypothetical protein